MFTEYGGSKSSQLRLLLQPGPLCFLMGAHDALSAKIAERAGFHGIWGSSLCISASLGLRDRNEISWTELLDVAEMMNETTQLPILLDADDGHGDFNNARLLVRRASRRGIAGVSLEDKPFPKRNSLLDGPQALVPVDEFCGKIKACRDACGDDQFMLVARTETFVAGHPVAEALARANSYAEAGADAVIVHSKARTSDDVGAFMTRWDQACPVLVIPTTYPDTPTREFERIGVSGVIWANHALRASILAMRAVCARIAGQGSIMGVDGDVAAVADIFDLVEQSELDKAENRYCGQSQDFVAA